MKMKKSTKIITVLISIAVVLILWIAFCGYQWSWGPFAKLHDVRTSKMPGNDISYSPDNQQVDPVDELKGKKIVFLGSSVTYGAASKGISFADYISKKNDCEMTKEAVSGTTLVDDLPDSYISRLKKIKDTEADLFICQLSTNDATQKKGLGQVSDSQDMDDFDTHTVAGAIEYTIAYARDRWDCPVIFYTNSRYNSDRYAQMVKLLYDIADKWDVNIIDMYSDDDFNNISDEERSLYMADSIHPTQAGYQKWWTPYMEDKLVEFLR
ncbi:MAG: SGNH/GDSL hydrolase family protein [Lachnospiraceae bacterium]|nr:SGNH/GDSL hydrolase family protein [Lachnospiraceae bacterium]